MTDEKNIRINARSRDPRDKRYAEFIVGWRTLFMSTDHQKTGPRHQEHVDIQNIIPPCFHFHNGEDADASGATNIDYHSSDDSCARFPGTYDVGQPRKPFLKPTNRIYDFTF